MLVFSSFVLIRDVVVFDDICDLVGQLARLDMCVHLAGRPGVGMSKGPLGGCGSPFPVHQFTNAAASAMGFQVATIDVEVRLAAQPLEH
jgi:hypothetical protein